MPIALSSVPTVKMQEMGGCWLSCCDRVKGRTEQMPCWWPSGTLAKGEEEGTARRDSGEIKENRDGDARNKKKWPAGIRCIASGQILIGSEQTNKESTARRKSKATVGWFKCGQSSQEKLRATTCGTSLKLWGRGGDLFFSGILRVQFQAGFLGIFLPAE